MTAAAVIGNAAGAAATQTRESELAALAALTPTAAPSPTTAPEPDPTEEAAESGAADETGPGRRQRGRG